MSPDNIKTRNDLNSNLSFKKAPSSNGGQQFSPALPPQIEEKTLVYVLVKKHEPQEHFDSPVVPQAPSKPEVYFIKYRAKSGGRHEQSPASAYGPPAHGGVSNDFNAGATAAGTY